MNCIILKSTTVSQSYTTLSLTVGAWGMGVQIFNGPYLNFQVFCCFGMAGSVAMTWQVSVAMVQQVLLLFTLQCKCTAYNLMRIMCPAPLE